jgi:C4-dicarboxylate-specific signal transduction histidine kinase
LRWLANNPPNVEEAKQSVTRIVKDGHRASEVVGRVRAFFKKANPTTVKVNINSLIEEVISMVHGELRRNHVHVRTELTRGLPAVVSDPIQLQQVLLNLIINAIEAMSAVSGRRELVIKTESHDSGVLVAVQDSGPGIAQQDAAQLFDAFFTTKPAGLGMGLSISRTTIEAYGGRLWATAGETGGATFQFTLPTTDGQM